MTNPKDEVKVIVNPNDKRIEDEIIKVQKEHPQVSYRIEVEGMVCYLRKIDRATLEQAMGLMMKTRGNPEYIRAGEVILLNCWVTGDDIIKSDEQYLMAACMTAYELMEMKSATLKKI